MSYEKFAKQFEGWTAEELEEGFEFLKRISRADTETRETIREVLKACANGVSLTDAINGITNKETRVRWIEHAKEAGVYDNPIEKTA